MKMKKHSGLILVALITIVNFQLSIVNGIAQPTNKMNYQAVARSSSGAILGNQLLGILITIEDGSAGSVLYQERQTPA